MIEIRHRQVVSLVAVLRKRQTRPWLPLVSTWKGRVPCQRDPALGRQLYANLAQSQVSGHLRFQPLQPLVLQPTR